MFKCPSKEKSKKCNFKLTYFNLRARAEFIRYIFHHAEVEFENETLTFEDWAKTYKTKMPLGQVPVLYVDGKPIAQAMAIGSFLGRTFDLAGKDNFEAAICDMLGQGICQFITDHNNYNYALVVGQNDKAKADEIWAEIKKEKLPTFLGQYNKILTHNGTGWFVGEKITWADLCVGEFLARMEEVMDPTALDNFPSLREHYKKFMLCRIYKNMWLHENLLQYSRLYYCFF